MGERIWSDQQKVIFEWFRTSLVAGVLYVYLVVRARAGTGKTTTILEAINYAPEPTIIFCAFNKRIADHIKGKLTNPRAESKTLHAIGNSFITERWGYIKTADRDERADDLTRQACEAFGSVDVPFQILRLISKLHTKARELTPHATTSEQLDYLVDQFECEPDEEFEEMGYNTAFVVRHALKAMVLATTKPKPHPDTFYAGGIDFADMIFLPIRNKWLRPKYDLVVVDEAQDMAAAQLELAQGICKGRMCLVGDDRQCQPAGTMVRVSDRGDVPIEGLKVGDTVETFDRYGQVFIKSGQITGTSSRPFSGFLVKVCADDKVTLCTPTHKWLVRWANKSTHTWITYLMRQGNRWRVGQTQLFRHETRNFGLSERARVERADEAWVLKTHESLADALAYEAIVTVIYGLPQMVFHPPSNIKHFTQAVIDTVYDSFDEDQQRQKAEQCLVNHWRDVQFPIYKKADPYTRRGRTTLFETQACNLLGGYMSVAVAPDVITGHDKKDRHAVRWSPVAVHRELFQGLVYSLNIAKHHKYVADGLVTCNSIYGFRGADSNALDRLKTILKAGEVGLNTTYRCGHVIVRHNQRLVPDFFAHHANHEGVIRAMKSWVEMVAEANLGDFILSRKNAPLAEIAMALIRANKRVKIAGRSIGKGLETVAKKLATGAAERSIPMFLQKLQTWTEKECKRAMKSAKNEAQGYEKCDAIKDKAETLTFLTDGILSVRELLVRIADLFPKREDGTDVDPSTVVLLSSIHKAKGLEAERVYVLVDTLYALPKKGKIPADRMREEENLDYVACTRAIHELVLVGQNAAGMLQQPLPVTGGIYEPVEPQSTEDIDDKAAFDALAAAVHEIEGGK